LTGCSPSREWRRRIRKPIRRLDGYIDQGRAFFLQHLMEVSAVMFPDEKLVLSNNHNNADVSIGHILLSKMLLMLAIA
jgi:hypothetical protein